MFNVKCTLLPYINTTTAYNDCKHAYMYKILACTNQQHARCPQKHTLTYTKKHVHKFFKPCNGSQRIFLETCFLIRSCAHLLSLYITKKTAKWLLNGKNLRLINYQKQDDPKHLCQGLFQALFDVYLPAQILNLKLSV